VKLSVPPLEPGPWREFPAAALGIPHNLVTKMTSLCGTDRPATYVRGAMKEKAYGRDQFTCGNDRTLSDKRTYSQEGSAGKRCLCLGFHAQGSTAEPLAWRLQFPLPKRSSEACKES